ncbi:MAG: hypothetical protein ACREBU_11055, partial [Nitrososphaera sp.]
MVNFFNTRRPSPDFQQLLSSSEFPTELRSVIYITMSRLEGVDMEEHVCRFLLHDGEAVCGRCGIVSDERTAEYLTELTVEQQMQANSEDHYVANSGLLTEHGTHHSYVSKSNKGLCFLLGDLKARDFARKRVKTTMLKDGYGTGLYVERNGYFEFKDGKPKFKVDYARDKWVIEMKQLLHQLSAELDLEIHERVQAGKELRHLQGAVI